MFYIAQNRAQYPIRRTTQSASHFTPWQTCSFWHELDFSGKHSSHAAITILSHFHRYVVYIQVLIFTAESTGVSRRERKCPNGRMDEQTDRRTKGRMDGTDGRTDERRDTQHTSECENRQKDRRTEGHSTHK